MPILIYMGIGVLFIPIWWRAMWLEWANEKFHFGHALTAVFLWPLIAVLLLWEWWDDERCVERFKEGWLAGADYERQRRER